MEEFDNPFFHNYLWSDKDKKRSKITKPWWEWPWLFFLPTYVQINDGYAWFYKQWGNRYFYVGYESIYKEDRA